MTPFEPLVTNLELRESNPDGSEGAGLQHKSEGMFLLHVKELASDGEPRGAIMLVHDVGDHGGRYLDLANAVAEDDWAVALPDLRGNGESEGERGHSWGVKEVLRDIDSVLDHLAYRLPDAPKVLIGVGLGATQALAYACEHPGRVAAVVAGAPLLAPSFQPPAAPTGLGRLFKKVGPTSPGATGWIAAQRSGDAETQRAWDADPHTHEVVTARAAEAAAEAASYRARFGELHVPVLVLQGRDDPLCAAVDAEGLAGASVEVRLLDGVGHDLFHGPEARDVTSQVRAWLDEKVPRGTSAL